MDKFYEKLSIICGNILIYGDGVIGVNKPIRINEEVHIGIKDNMGSIKVVVISISDICKAHDYTLDNLIVRILEDNNLIHV